MGVARNPLTMPTASDHPFYCDSGRYWCEGDISPGIGRYADQRLPSDFDLAFGFRTSRPRIAGHRPTYQE
jgi:hypothetical protein